MSDFKLYEHQKEIILRDPHRHVIGFGCGAGKTRTALLLSRMKGKILVVAPKTQVLDQTWEKEIKKLGIKINLGVVSKERFKKDWEKLSSDVLILDEGHCFLGVTPQTRQKNYVQYPKTSELYRCVKEYITRQNVKYVYIVSGTPFPQPMAVWGAANLFDLKWDYFKFRQAFYTNVPRIGRGVWLPRKDSAAKDRLAKAAKKFSTFGRLEDFFDVPDQTFKDTEIPLSKTQEEKILDLPLDYPLPLPRILATHQVEQETDSKAEYAVDIAKEFPKLLLFCRYTEQIDRVAAYLRKTFKNKDILVLDGRTKDRKSLLELAEKQGRETIVIAQSQVSAGYELPSFRCTMFLSMSYSYVDYAQALGRTQRANNISKNLYIHVLSGEVDKAVLKCIINKEDFNERLYAEKMDKVRVDKRITKNK